MLEAVAEHALGTLELVVIVLAIEEVVADLPSIVAFHRPLVRHAGVITALRILLQIGHERQGRVVGDVPGHRWRDGIALLLDRVELGIRTAGQPHHAIGGPPLVVQRAGQIERRAALTVVADAEPQLTMRLELRLLAGQRHQATGGGAPVEYGGRSLDDFDALQEIRIDHHRAVTVGIAHDLEAIEIGIAQAAVGEPSHDQVVVAVGGADLVGIDARRILRGFPEGAGVTLIHLVAVDTRDGLGGFDNRRLCLGGGLARDRHGGQIDGIGFSALGLRPARHGDEHHAGQTRAGKPVGRQCATHGKRILALVIGPISTHFLWRVRIINF